MKHILSLHHSSVVVSDLAVSRKFYEDLLGLTLSNKRPKLPYDGAWYEIGDQQIHLLAVPNCEAGLVRPAHGGVDRHIALKVADIEALKADLDRAGVRYSVSKSGRPALFCRDPDNNALEFMGSGL
ncbi:MAG: glyoxalase [Gammaproteobacteria bacterium]|nr:glyoxalase [Gammaproteobacteria bacterium]